jgi:DNA-binding response OmpR family regulator
MEDQQPPARKKKILLVEDDKGLAKVYKTRLEAEGFEVNHVPNGEDALSEALEYKPDLILLDVMMPKISGFDVLDILRNTPDTNNIRIIMLTALSQESDIEKAKSLGVDDYLVKSQVVIADVVERIKYHLGMKSAPSVVETDESVEALAAAKAEAAEESAEQDENQESQEESDIAAQEAPKPDEN